MCSLVEGGGWASDRSLPILKLDLQLAVVLMEQAAHSADHAKCARRHEHLTYVIRV